MESFFANLKEMPTEFVVLVVLAALLLWFLPVLLAYFFNRRHLKLIAVACVPAGLSIIAWSALMLWAVTGNAVEKYLPQKVRDKLAQQTLS